MSNKKQTAVEWLVNKYFGREENCSPNFRHKIKEAKEMEKQQIIDAWDKGDYCVDLPDGTWEQKYKSGEQYYNENYEI